MDPGEAEEPDREELAGRVEQLEQTVSKMLPDRRGVLKGLGAAAVGGAAVGGATGGASGQSAAGQVGTESEPVDVEAASVAAQSVKTVESLLESDGPLPDKPRLSSLYLRGSSEAGGIILQNQDDSVGSGAGKASIYWYSDAEERIAVTTAHPSDNHYSIYTKPDAVGSGDTALTKRLDIGGGSSLTPALWRNISTHRVDGSAIIEQDVSGSSPTLRLESSGSGTIQTIRFQTSGEVNQYYLQSRSDDSFRLYNFTAGSPAFILDGATNRWDWQGNPMAGLREITNPTVGDLATQEWAWDATDDRWMFKDSGGVVHGFNPDTTY